MSQRSTVLITRDLTRSQRSLAGNLGLNIIEEPALSIEFRSNWLTAQDAIEHANTPIFVFTSQNGVKAFDQFLKAGMDYPRNAPVYAVGGKTAMALNDIGFKGVITPDQQNGVGLAHKLVDDILKNPDLKDATALHFCGDKRRDELRHYLTESDIAIKDIVIYSTNLNRMDLPDESLDGILFYSPSAVQAFRQSGGFRNLSEGTELFAIGPTTAEELSIESGRHVHISPEPDTEVLLRFVARVLGEVKVKGEK